MRGVTYIVDESGAKKAVQIDLRTWGKIWEDFHDVLVSEARKNEPSVSWDVLKAEMEREEERKLAEYAIGFAESAAKEFRRLPSDIKRRVADLIDLLPSEPRPRGVTKLKGHEHLYRLRAGVYRVVYEINDQAQQVRITRIRHGREAYD